MSSAAVLKATGGVLTKERYHSLFKTFRAQSKGDFQEEASYDLVQQLPEDIESIRWLSVGPGMGDREESLIRCLRRHRPSAGLDRMDVYEPNGSFCAALRKKIAASRAAEDGVWSSFGEIFVHERGISGAESERLEEDGAEYHIVTLPHVIYYIATEEERRRLLLLLHRHLAPSGGLLWILVMGESDSQGRTNKHVELFRTFHSRINPRSKRRDPVMAESLWEEYLPLARDLGMRASKKAYLWQALLGPTVECRQYGEMLSFMLEKELETLSPEVAADVHRWVDKNATFDNREGQLRLHSIDTAIVFVKEQ